MGTPEDLRAVNRARIVDALRRHGAVSRSDLARLTGLSRSTVISLAGELQAHGLVVEQGQSAGERRGRGRPGVRLRLDPSAGVALGLDAGPHRVRVAVADLSSELLAERCVALEPGADALDAAAELAVAALADARLDRDHVLGACLALAAPVEHDTGAVGAPLTARGWAGPRPGEALGKRLGTAVEVDNDANLEAVAEATLGAARGCENVVYVKVADGIGAGLILGGRLYRGASGLAGELGHVQVVDDGDLCRCGNRGCLGTVAASGPLVRALRRLHGPDLTVPALLELVAAGDPGAQRVVADGGRAIGRVLAHLCDHVNPEAIVVGGELAAAAPLLEGIRESVDRHALPAAAEAVRVLAASLGDRAGVLGAVISVVGDTERVASARLAALGA
jgi:predicted NBD/HSP70 family sugar kinase